MTCNILCCEKDKLRRAKESSSFLTKLTISSAAEFQQLDQVFNDKIIIRGEFYWENQ